MARRLVRRAVDARPRLSRRPRVFVVGCNKTGTSTVTQALGELGGWKVRDVADLGTFDAWMAGDFAEVARRSRHGDVFADVPYGLPGTFAAMDAAFPGSKFVLTVWPSAERWFEAYSEFLARKIGGGTSPTAAQIRAFSHRRTGYVAEVLEHGYGLDGDGTLDRQVMIAAYEAHRRAVIEYFDGRPDDLLVLDIGEPDALERLAQFVGLDAGGGSLVLGRADHGFAEHGHDSPITAERPSQ